MSDAYYGMRAEQDDAKVIQRLVECGWLTKFQSIVEKNKRDPTYSDSHMLFWRGDELNYVRYFSEKGDDGYVLVTFQGKTLAESVRMFLVWRDQMQKNGISIKLEGAEVGLEFHESN